jgi:hypothetical protein
MLANPKQIFIGVFLTLTLSGCGIEFSESPESWGSKSGAGGAKAWIEKEGASVYPNVDGVAAYCASMAEEGQKKFNWTVEQVFASSDACAEAFVAELK